MSDVLFKLKVLWWSLSDAYGGWKVDVWQKDLDAPYCCPGKFRDQCACGGMTVRELWSYEALALREQEEG